MLCSFDTAWTKGNNICEINIWKEILTTQTYGLDAVVIISNWEQKNNLGSIELGLCDDLTKKMRLFQQIPATSIRKDCHCQNGCFLEKVQTDFFFCGFCPKFHEQKFPFHMPKFGTKFLILEMTPPLPPQWPRKWLNYFVKVNEKHITWYLWPLLSLKL